MIDSLDQRIIKELTKDARMSARALASKLGVATSTVVARMSRLERKGIVTGYSVNLDHERLGFELTVIIEINAKKGKIVEAEEHITRLPNVLAVYDVTGLSDCIIVARFRNRPELDAFVKHLQEIPSVERTITHLVLNVVKEDFNSLNLTELARK